MSICSNDGLGKYSRLSGYTIVHLRQVGRESAIQTDKVRLERLQDAFFPYPEAKQKLDDFFGKFPDASNEATRGIV